MPELPEVEMIVRLVSREISGSKIQYVRVAGIGTLKSYDPPLSALEGQSVERLSRRGKHVLLHASGDLVLLMHLMSSGRLQLFNRLGSLRDKTSRLLIGLSGGSELRLREFGSHQSAWAKLLRAADVDGDDALADLGPEAWPDPPELKKLLAEPRPLHTLLRDQKVIAGIGRSWVDEILHAAKLSPFKRGSDLSAPESKTLRREIRQVLTRAIEHYEEVLTLPVPDKLPMPLQIHRRQGEPCPRCQTKIEAVHFDDHDMCYCPVCQTEGRILKDRRLSRILK